MQMRYCYGCERMTGHKRKIGVGSLILVLFTWIWLLAIPFYRVRCVICGIANPRGHGPKLADRRTT
ncbi:MAG TPA: hypothetical protein VFM97_09545 [Gammaproteobacteria bacterium]|nr:hypothetical protein [Gammaproteobacteria bacterium]